MHTGSGVNHCLCNRLLHMESCDLPPYSEHSGSDGEVLGHKDLVYDLGVKSPFPDYRSQPRGYSQHVSPPVEGQNKREKDKGRRKKENEEEERREGVESRRKGME